MKMEQRLEGCGCQPRTLRTVLQQFRGAEPHAGVQRARCGQLRWCPIGQVEDTAGAKALRQEIQKGAKSKVDGCGWRGVGWVWSSRPLGPRERGNRYQQRLREARESFWSPRLWEPAPGQLGTCSPACLPLLGSPSLSSVAAMLGGLGSRGLRTDSPSLGQPWEVVPESPGLGT